MFEYRVTSCLPFGIHHCTTQLSSLGSVLPSIVETRVHNSYGKSIALLEHDSWICLCAGDECMVYSRRIYNHNYIHVGRPPHLVHNFTLKDSEMTFSPKLC